MTVREFIDDCKRRLLPLYGKEEAASLASRALEDIFNISRTHQLTYPEEEQTYKNKKYYGNRRLY